MQPRSHIARSVHFHYAAEPPSILRRNSCGIDAHGLHILRPNLRPKTGRPVIRQRNSIHHKLRLVLRATRVQYGVPFIQPSRLRIHQILQRAPRRRPFALLNFFISDPSNRSHAMRIDQRIALLHGDHCADKRDCQSHPVFRRNRRPNVHSLGKRCKALPLHLHAIKPKRQKSRCQRPLFVRH